jgi:hypothetical protein
MGELSRIATRCADLVDIHVVLYAPSDVSPEWSETDLWRSATNIPHVRVSSDKGGVVCERFCVETSGHVLLYDADGQVVFSGGITGSRGHAGDNNGRTLIELFLLDQDELNQDEKVAGRASRNSDKLGSNAHGRTVQFHEAPVFGCSLSDCTIGEGQE